jgi:hypothetical protein
MSTKSLISREILLEPEKFLNKTFFVFGSTCRIFVSAECSADNFRSITRFAQLIPPKRSFLPDDPGRRRQLSDSCSSSSSSPSCCAATQKLELQNALSRQKFATFCLTPRLNRFWGRNEQIMRESLWRCGAEDDAIMFKYT